jgi:hypothetical protein
MNSILDVKIDRKIDVVNTKFTPFPVRWSTALSKIHPPPPPPKSKLYNIHKRMSGFL